MNKKDLTETISDAFKIVYDTLGYGFNKEIYEKAFMMELDTRNIQYCHKMPVNVYYDDVSVGKCVPDFLIGFESLILIGTMNSISEEECQKLKSYCDTTCCDRGYLLNFGVIPEFKIYEGADLSSVRLPETQSENNYAEQSILF